MTLAEFIENVNYAFRGSDDTAPASGSDDWIYWVRIANRKKNELYRDTSRTWSDAFEVRSIGTISVTTTPTFNLATDFIVPSDQAYVITTDSEYEYIDLIKPQERTTTARQAYISGNNPRVLSLTTAVTTGEAIVGGTLYMPGYYLPDDIDHTDDAAVIPTLDPDWLVLVTAAELAANDLTYEEKAPDLFDKATALYRQMTILNRRGTYNNPRITPTRVNRIKGFR